MLQKGEVISRIKRCGLVAVIRAESSPVPVDLSQIVKDVSTQLLPALDAAGAKIELGALPVIDALPKEIEVVSQRTIHTLSRLIQRQQEIEHSRAVPLSHLFHL